ncbi:hypothetical protein EYC80_002814 [Monilinia laxa]|uniref:Uncharacterized protein n=1 Tax=Monilinia laxa TaxID=61186 RepID=A0A5N6KBT7_MONLA|nr:hypothetical protein EYC80_002814 [Monilinia laxa]
MPDSRLTKEFEKMDARQLQHFLSLICKGRTFSLRVAGAKINVNAENVSITTQGTHEDKPDSYNFKDRENYKQRDDNKNYIAKDTPKDSKSKIEKLVKSTHLMTVSGIQANHDVEKYGAIEDLVHDPGFKYRCVRSCCGGLGSDDGCKGTRHMVPKEYGESEDSSGDSSESEGFEDTSRDSSKELEEIEASISQKVENGCNNGVEEGRKY